MIQKIKKILVEDLKLYNYIELEEINNIDELKTLIENLGGADFVKLNKYMEFKLFDFILSLNINKWLKNRLVNDTNRDFIMGFLSCLYLKEEITEKEHNIFYDIISNRNLYK